MEGCAYLGITYRWTGHTDYYRFAGLVRKACDAGDLLGCDYRHEMSLKNRYERDHELAVEMEGKACAHGITYACSLLGDCYDPEQLDCGLHKDGKRADIFYEKACEAGDEFQCSQLVNFGAGNKQRFVELQRNACEAAGNPKCGSPSP